MLFRINFPDGIAVFIHLLIFKKMYELFLALVMAFSCPAHNHKTDNSNKPIVSRDDTGGDNGHLPPPPPPPGS